MGYIGNYRGLEVYDYNGATAAKFASVENRHIYACSWRTSTEANVYFRGEFFGTLVEKSDGGYRMEPKETEEKPVKETAKKPLPVPKETEEKSSSEEAEAEAEAEEKRIDIDLYFQKARESIDSILADLKSKDLDYETKV